MPYISVLKGIPEYILHMLYCPPYIHQLRAGPRFVLAPLSYSYPFLFSRARFSPLLPLLLSLFLTSFVGSRGTEYSMDFAKFFIFFFCQDKAARNDFSASKLAETTVNVEF